VGKKLKFSFSASRLDECMAHLRNLNGDFATLSSQIVRMGEGNTTTRTSHRRSIETDGKISEFQAIRIASQQVYNALGKACTIHTRHSAQLCLEAKRATSNRTQVRLDMAFTHLALSGSAMLGDPMWFAIESITNDLRASDPATMHRSSPDKALSELTKTLKRPEEVSSIPCKVKKLKFTKSVRFAVSESSTDPVVAPDQSSSTSSLTQEHPLPDLCVRSNFCMQMRKCSDQYRRDTDVCIGILEKTSSCEHLVYLPPLADTRCVKEGVSLTQLISSMTRKNLGEMLPQYERLRLAKSLAVAILQFQATPWLAGPWRSQDVLFFDLDNSNSLRGLALTTPYLNVPIASQQSGQPMHPSTIAAKSCLAPNPLLYSFGVVLLELAYEAPLQSLQQPCDLEGGQESRYAEFFAARRLSKTLGSMLGSTYAQIVRKCLTCDFGGGDDLRDQTLQAEFYRDVVCELERLEGGFRKLQLGT